MQVGRNTPVLSETFDAPIKQAPLVENEFPVMGSTSAAPIAQQTITTTTVQQQQQVPFQQGNFAGLFPVDEKIERIIEKPIVQEIHEQPIVKEVIEKPTIQTVRRDIIHEIHEKPQIEFREQPILVTKRDQPVYTHVQEQQVIEDFSKRPEVANPYANLTPQIVREKEIITEVREAAVVREVREQPIVEIHYQPVIREIHEKQIIEIHEQQIIRKYTDQPVINVVRQPEQIVNEVALQQQFPQWKQATFQQQAPAVVESTTISTTTVTQQPNLLATSALPASTLSSAPSTMLPASGFSTTPVVASSSVPLASSSATVLPATSATFPANTALPAATLQEDRSLKQRIKNAFSGHKSNTTTGTF